MTKQFSDFGIEAPKARFTGNKIKISYIVDKKIKVLDYVVEPSKFEGSRLRLQFLLNEEKRITFTSAKGLIKQIKNIPEETAFDTTIRKSDEEQLLFT